MSSPEDAPLYNLKAVVRESGLKPDTIRAWERRYGLPRPQRSPGGHRLYSQRDISSLRWLIARKQEGLSISQAVQMWKQLEGAGQDPLDPEPRPIPSATAEAPTSFSGKSLDEAREAWIQACLRFDEAGAERVLTQALAAFPVETVCINVLQAGVAAMGEKWYANEVTVQHEHFATELAMRKLEALVASSPAPQRPEKLLVGCATGDLHTFAALLLVLLLRRRGWGVIFLGANVPLDRLETTLKQVQPDLVLLTAQHLLSAAGLQAMGRTLRQAGIRMAYGGAIFNNNPDLRARIPGDFLGELLDQAPAAVDRIFRTPSAIPEVSEPAPSLLAALQEYRNQQGRIESHVQRQLTGSGIDLDDLQTANHLIGQGFGAAVSLGDLAYLSDNLPWVQGYLASHGINHGMLETYLSAYQEAARDHLRPEGAPILSWLDSLALEPRPDR